MKLAIDVQNANKILTPSPNNVIVFDGKRYYVTTREDLFREYELRCDKLLTEAKEKIAQLETDNANFKKEISSQISTMAEIIEGLISKQGE